MSKNVLVNGLPVNIAQIESKPSPTRSSPVKGDLSSKIKTGKAASGAGGGATGANSEAHLAA